jgi:hypothetical protein
MADALSYKDLYNASHLNQYSATGYVEELTRNRLEKPTLSSKILNVEASTDRIRQDAVYDEINKRELKRTRPMPVSYESDTTDRDLVLEKALGYDTIPDNEKYRTTAEELSGLSLGIVSPSTVQKGLSSGNMLLQTLKGEDTEKVKQSWRRTDGTYKGPGWLGDVGDDNETVTEKSIGVSFDGKETLIPSIVPNSTPEEIQSIKDGNITPDITRKAIDFAKLRMGEGKSPFKQWNEDDPWVNLPEATKMPNVLPLVKELSNAIPTIVRKDSIPILSQFATAIGNYMIDVAPTEPMGLFDGSAMSKKILGIPELPKDETTSKFQSWMNRKNEEIQLQKSKWDEGSVGSYASQAYQSIGMQIPSYAAGILAKNPNVSLAIMYATSAGNATQAYIDKGVDKDTAVAAGKLEGHFEWMTEVVPTSFMFKAMKSSLPKNLLKMSLNDIGFEQVNSGLQQVVQDITTGVTPDSHSMELYKSTLITSVAQMGVMSGVATTVNKLQSVPASINTINKINKERERIIEEYNGRITQYNALGLISVEDMNDMKQPMPDVTKTPWETFKAMSGAYLNKSSAGAVGPDITKQETDAKIANLMKQRNREGGLPYKKTPEREFLDSLKPYIDEVLKGLSPKMDYVGPSNKEREENTLAYYEYLTGRAKGNFSDIYKTLYGEDYAEVITEFNKTANRYSISEAERSAGETFRHYFGKGSYSRPFYSTEEMDESISANYSVQVMDNNSMWSPPKEVTYLQRAGDNYVISVNNTIQSIPSSNIAFIKMTGDTTLPSLEAGALTYKFIGENPNTLFISTDKSAKPGAYKALGKRVDNITTIDIDQSDENYSNNQIVINEKIRQIKASLFNRKYHPQASYNVKNATFNNMQGLLNRNLPITLFRRGVDEGDIVEIQNEDGRSLLLRVSNVQHENNEELAYAYINGKPEIVEDSPIAKRKLTLRAVTDAPQGFSDVHTSINIGKSLQARAPKTYQYLLSEIYNLKVYADTMQKLRDSALTELWVNDETKTTIDYDIKETAIRKTIDKKTKETVTQRKVSVIKEHGVAPDGTIIYQTTGGLYSAFGDKYIDNKETNKLQKVKQTLKVYGQPAPFKENDYIYGRNNFISAILAGHKQSIILSTDKIKNIEVGDIIDLEGSMKAAQVRVLRINRDIKEQLDIQIGGSGYPEVLNTKLRDDVTLTEGLTDYIKAKSGKEYNIPGVGIIKMFHGPKAPFAKINASRIVFEVIPKIEKKKKNYLRGESYSSNAPSNLTEAEFAKIKKFEVTDTDREYNFIYGKIVEAISQDREQDLNNAVNYGVKLGLFPIEAAQSIIDNALEEIEEKPAYKTFINYVTSLGAEMTSFMKVSEPAESYLPDVAIGQGNLPGPGTKNVAPTMYQDPETAFLGDSFTQVFPFKEGGREVLITGSDLKTHYIRHHDSVRDALNEFIRTDGASGLSPNSELAASHFFIYPDLYKEFGKDSLINEKLKKALEADLEREKSIVPQDFVLATDKDMKMLDADPTAVNRLRKEMMMEFSDEETAKQEEFVANVTSAHEELKDTDITVDDIKEIGKPTGLISGGINIIKKNRGSFSFGKVSTVEGVDSKNKNKTFLKSLVKKGLISDNPVRMTDVGELASIVKNKSLGSGRPDAEGRIGISAQYIDGKKPVVGYGDNNRISIGIIFDKSDVESEGNAPNEIKIKPNTDVTKLRFTIGGREKVFTFDEVVKVYSFAQANANPYVNTPYVTKGTRGSFEVPFQDVAIRLVNFFKRLYKNEDYNRFSQTDLDKLNKISAAIDKVNINIVDYLDTASRMGLTIEEFLENMYAGQGIKDPDKLAVWTISNIVDPKVFEYIYQDAVEYLFDKAEDRAKTTTFINRVTDLAKEKSEQASEYVEYKASMFENMMSNLTFFGEAPEAFKTEVSNLYASIRDLSMERAKIDSILWKKLSREDKKLAVRIVTAKDNIARIRRYNLDKIGGKPLEYWAAVLRNITVGSHGKQGLMDMDPKRSENIKSSVAAWGSMTNLLFNDLKVRGMADDVEHLSDYAPYYVYDPSLGISKRAIKSSLKRYFVVPEKLKEPQYNYLKEVVGTNKPRLLTPDMMTDFIVSVRHDMLVSESIKKICELYDKKRDVSDFDRNLWGKDEFGNTFENPPVTKKMTEINGINYVVYSPEDFSFGFSLDPATGREYKAGNARSYLVPEKISGYLNEMTNTPDAILRRMNSFVRVWKRSIIYTIFPSFNWNNAFGDMQMYLMTHPNKKAAIKELNPAFSFAVKYFREQAGREVVYNTHERRLKDFVDRYKTIESSQMVTDLTSLDDVNILKHIAKMFNKISTFRESILRVAVASYLVREIDYGRGEELKNTYKFMNIDPKLNYIEFAGRVSQDAMINYLRQSPTYRKWITGCLMPWGHFYFQGSKMFYKWVTKGNTPIEKMVGFSLKSALLTMPSLVANLWNQGLFSALMGDDEDAQKKKRREMRLHPTIRNRFHLIIGDKVWVPQIAPDILMGTKIYSILGNKIPQLVSGEINIKQFVRDTIKDWSLSEGKSMAYLFNPLIRFGIGVSSGKDLLDGTPVYPEFNRSRLESSQQVYYATQYFVKTMNTVFSSYVAARDKHGMDTEHSVLESLKRFAGPQEIFGVKDITIIPRIVKETGRRNYLLNQPGTVDITATKQEKEMEMDAKLSTILRDIESDWIRTGKSYKRWVKDGGLYPYKQEMKDLFGGKVNNKEAESINSRLKRMSKDEKNRIKMYENRIIMVGKDSELGREFQDKIYSLQRKIAKKNADTTKAVRGAKNQIERDIIEAEEE